MKRTLLALAFFSGVFYANAEVIVTSSRFSNDASSSDVFTTIVCPSPSREVTTTVFMLVSDMGGTYPAHAIMNSTPPVQILPGVYCYETTFTYCAQGYSGHPDIPFRGSTTTYPALYIELLTCYDTVTQQYSYVYQFNNGISSYQKVECDHQYP